LRDPWDFCGLCVIRYSLGARCSFGRITDWKSVVRGWIFARATLEPFRLRMRLGSPPLACSKEPVRSTMVHNCPVGNTPTGAGTHWEDESPSCKATRPGLQRTEPSRRPV
jgi:hypothetical protein